MRAEHYLSKDTMQSLKGFFAIGVLIHHIYQYSAMDFGTLGIVFQMLGYLSVGMFFFFSGYGLMLSSEKKCYIETVWKKRVVPLYVFYSMLILTFSVYSKWIGIDFSLHDFIQSFLFGKTIVPLAWYLQVTILFYLLFWFVFMLVKNDVARFYTMLAVSVLYCVLCNVFGLASTWFESIFALNLGMIWAWKKDRINSVFEKHSVLVAIGALILFCVSFAGQVSVLSRRCSQFFSSQPL